MRAPATRDERQDAGRALRAEVPRSAHAEWNASDRDADPVAVLEGPVRTRVDEVVPVRYERMAASPFAFYRGAAAVMASDLATTPVTGLTVQACGDAPSPTSHVRHSRTQRDLRRQRLRRDRSGSVGVGRQASRRQPARRDDRGARVPRVRAPVRGDAHPRRLVRPDHADDLVEHFPKRYRAQAQRDLTRALRKDHLRAVTKLTTDAGGRPRFVETPRSSCTVRFGHEGRRVVVGQRLTQAASDIFLGWCEAPSGHHSYVRQLWEVQGQGDLTRMELGKLTHYGALCARALARAHARTGDAPAVAGYLGTGPVFDEAVARFAAVDAAHDLRDHGALVEAIAAGQVPSRSRS